jgi:hypothetical protein
MEMLFLIVVKRIKIIDHEQRPKSSSLFFPLLSFKQRLYCCLLFFFNFFQYVKELFYPGFPLQVPIYVPFILSTGDGGE